MCPPVIERRSGIRAGCVPGAAKWACAGESLSSINLPNCAEIVRKQGDMMNLVYAKLGGLCSSVEVVELLRDRCDQPISLLARWLVGRSVVSMPWRSRLLLPMFQFNLERSIVRPEVAAVVAELTGIFDDFEIAHWFAEPNAWLAGLRPVEILEGEPLEVLRAARADRYVACGS